MILNAERNWTAPSFYQTEIAIVILMQCVKVGKLGSDERESKMNQFSTVGE